jgi:hypothetical protein
MKPRNEGGSIDEVIDDVIAESLSGEPRVTGQSTRAAAAARRKSWLPLWAAVAAVFVIGLLVRGPAMDRPRPIETARTSPVPAPSSASASISTAMEPLSGFSPGNHNVLRASRVGNQRNAEPYEGLPRLEIAPIEAPNPLTTDALAAAVLIIPHIEITPLSTLGQADGSGGRN